MLDDKPAIGGTIEKTEPEDAEIASNAHPRNIELEELIEKCIKQPHPVFAVDLEQNFLKIPKENGRYILSLHGEPTRVFLYGEPIDAKTLANIIKSRSDYNGEDEIVLISCNTGNEKYTKMCFAQRLANEMSKTVIAPTEYGAISPFGKYYSSTAKGFPSGCFKPFEPIKKE